MGSTIVRTEDLCGDKLLTSASRLTMDDKPVPAIGGIPLLAKLGQGGMGAVYVGMHPRLKQEVAVKVLPFPLMAQQPDMVDRFYREAQIAAKIKSNHLVGVSDVNEESGLFYIVMEFVNGVSAGSHLKQNCKSGASGLREADALDICIAASMGLTAAHAEGIIHRDVKPDNILIPKSKQGELQLTGAKLADLGLARSEDLGQSLTGAQTAMGTPGFMAPEQCMDAKKARKPADVFSMGATLFTLLTGRAPFTGETTMETVLATLQKPAPAIKQLRPDVHAPTAAVIQRCLEKDPERRYADGAALLEALQACRAGAPAVGNPGNAGAVTVARATAPTIAKSDDPTLLNSPARSRAAPASGLERTLASNPFAVPSAPPARPLVPPAPRPAAHAVRTPPSELFKAKPTSNGGSKWALAGVGAAVAVIAAAVWYFTSQSGSAG